MSMNISATDLNASIGVLSSIKGDVTEKQLSDLTSLFSANIWNTSDVAGTTQTIERQMRDLEMLIDEIETEIEKLYDQQKAENDKMNELLNNMNEESYQATKQADKNVKEQQDSISKATDEAYTKYMRGDIEKEEIPMYIAKALKRSNSTGGAALQAHLTQMDSFGQSITSLSNKITVILDSVNEYTAKLKTTQTSLDLMAQLKAKIPQHQDRGAIEQTTARPYFSPSQEALGDKAIDAFKVTNAGTWADGDQSTILMNQALTASGAPVTAERKAQLDAMTPEDKAAAVEDADFSKYSVAELFYLSGMDAKQAACALGNVFRGAGIGYNKGTGALIVPKGHDATEGIYNELKSQFTTLWGGPIEEGSMTEDGTQAGADPIGWRDGDMNYMFAIDHDEDGKFDGAEEFLGAQQGWAEVTALDTDGNGILTADEAEAGGLRIVNVDQSLGAEGGTYGFNGVKESGFESIDLNSYNKISGVKNENLNGNTRTAEFNIVVNNKTVLGKQTENVAAYNTAFYGHMTEEAYTFGLDEADVSKALQEAAKPQDYTADTKQATADKVDIANEQIELDAETLATYVEIEKLNKEQAKLIDGAGLEREEDEEDDEEDEDTATGTTDNTAGVDVDNNTTVLPEELDV